MRRYGRFRRLTEAPCPNRLRPVLRTQERGIPAKDDLEPVSAFTSAFKDLDPVLQFMVTTKLLEFLEARFSQLF
jgi:hypothetical protein